MKNDLIIQVSQAEWDGLQDGVRPKDNFPSKMDRWKDSEGYKLLGKIPHITQYLWGAFFRNQIDGSIQSLQDIADGKIRVSGIGLNNQAKLKKLLDERT